jgi:two-component system, sensor histidine kinase and response regulator
VQALNRQLEDRVAERTAALLDALLHAEAATHAKAAFLRNISHELRTPLNPILGFSHLLEQAIADPEQQAQVRHIAAGGRRMLSLVTDLIELTRTSNAESSMMEVDLATMVEAAIDTFAAQAADKHLLLESHVDPAIPAGLTGDPVRVSQVLLQLLSNAIKFSDRGVVHVRSLLESAESSSVRVRFEVQDHGSGIDPSRLRHVFDAFRQVDVDATNQAGGLGIGLALAKRAVERMGGEIGAKSEVAVGSTFWFTVQFGMERSNSAAAPERLFG